MSESHLTILFLGDIVGRLGRAAVARLVPQLREKYSPDLVFANGENAAHGKGVTPLTIEEMLSSGIDYLTTGDHCFDQINLIEECFNGRFPILRPANYAPNVPGQGFVIIPSAKGDILLINLIGQTFMPRNFESPFHCAEKILASFTGKKFSAIIIDIHAETTAEKIALRHFLDGRISALLGTHTHVPTADAQITSNGSGYISDLGMTGDADGVIGIVAQPIVQSFITQLKLGHELAQTGRAQCNGVKLEIDPETGRCMNIEPIHETILIAS